MSYISKFFLFIHLSTICIISYSKYIVKNFFIFFQRFFHLSTATIIPFMEVIVKNFFYLFSKIFIACFAFQALAFCYKRFNCKHYTIFRISCQHFFQNILKIYFVFYLISAAFLTKDIIPNMGINVNTFFHKMK